MTGHSSCEAACMRTLVLALALAAAGSVARAEAPSAWEAESPVAPLPSVPLGVNGDLSELPYKPTPEKVRLCRRLFSSTHACPRSRPGLARAATCRGTPSPSCRRLPP